MATRGTKITGLNDLETVTGNTYAGNTANVFTFGITNNSGNTAVVNYGYTKL